MSLRQYMTYGKAMQRRYRPHRILESHKDALYPLELDEWCEARFRSLNEADISIHDGAESKAHEPQTVHGVRQGHATPLSAPS